MKRFLLPTLSLVLVLLPVGFSSAPQAARGQAADEPTYTLLLGPTTAATLRITAGAKECRLTGLQKPGTRNPLVINLLVTRDREKAVRAQNKGLNLSGTPVDLVATVEEKTLFVAQPAQSGASPIAAPVVTFVDFIATLGRRYDWKRGGPQTFVYLDPAIRRVFTTLTVEAEGKPEMLTLGKDPNAEPVQARRLKITTNLPELSETRRVTSLYVGPNGEAVKGEMPFTRYAITAEAPGAWEAPPEGGAHSGGRQAAKTDFVTRYPGGIEPQGNARLTRISKTAKGYTITYEGPPGYLRGTVETDAAFRPLKTDHLEGWRKVTTTLTPDRASWVLPEQKIGTPLKGEAWFVTHYVLTDLWENRAPFSELKPGESAPVTYASLEWGDKNCGDYTVQRLPDAALPDPDGKAVTLKHWQVSYAPYFAADLWTDGRRLVKLASSASPVIVRDGWEKATEKLVAPPKPAK